MTKYYAVRKGLKPGIYLNWEDAKMQVKGFNGNEYKSFTTRQAALNYMNQTNINKRVSSEKDILSDQKPRKYYAVRKGLKPGIYLNWNDAKMQVKGFNGNEYKSFTTRQDALDYMNEPSTNKRVILKEDILSIDSDEDEDEMNEKEIDEHDINEEEIDERIVYVDGGHNSMTGEEAWARVVDSEGNDLIKEFEYLLSDLLIKTVKLPVGNSYIIVSKFNDVKSQQNNGAELLAMLAALRMSVVDKDIQVICSDSQLIVSYWSKRLKNDIRVNMDPLKAEYIDEVIKLRKKFEARGGKILKISGDENLADLGFH